MKDWFGYETDRGTSQSQIQQTESESTSYENSQEEELGGTQEFHDHNEEDIDAAMLGRKRKLTNKVDLHIFIKYDWFWLVIY